MSLPRSVVLALAAGLLAGCGGDRPKTAPVKGKVALDGQPLASGEISFVPEGGSGMPDILPIVDGWYEGQVGVGKKKVEIYSFRLKNPVSLHGPGAGEPTRVNTLPARYNTQSAITHEVTEVGPNEFDFDLKSE